MDNKDVKLENQLSEEQLNTIVETLDNNVDPATDALNKVLAGEIPEGETVSISDDEIDALMDGDFSIFDDIPTLMGPIETVPVEESTELSEETEAHINSSLDQFGLSDDDTMELLSIIRRYKAGENFSVYNAMPESMKTIINRTIATANIGVAPDARIRNMFAKNMLDEFIMDADIDKEFDEFERQLKEELKIPNLMDMYSEHTRETMEEILPKKADELEAQYPETAANIRKVSANFTDSYKFDRVIDTLLHNRKARTRTIKDVDNLKRFIDEFNFIAGKGTIKIEDMGNVAKNLAKFFDGITNDKGLVTAPWISDEYKEKLYIDGYDVAKVIILICKTCKSLTIGDLFDTSFMYYTVKNISSLAHVDVEKPTDFSIEVANNLLKVVSKIRDVEAEREEEKKNDTGKKGKKKGK